MAAQQNAVVARTSVQQRLAQAQNVALGKANGQRAANWDAAAGQLFEGVGRSIELEVVQAANKVLGGINTTLNIAMVGEIFGGEELEPITGALRLGTDGLAAGAEALEASETAALDAAGGSLSAGAPAMADSFVPAAAASGAETGLASVADNVAADVSAAADNALANDIIQAGEQAGPEAVVNATTITDVPSTLLRNSEGRFLPRVYTAYQAFQDGVPVYAGVTRQTLAARLTQHLADGKLFTDLKPVYENITRRQARVIEQALIENNPGFQDAINSIARNRAWYQDAVNWGNSILKWSER